MLEVAALLADAVPSVETVTGIGELGIGGALTWIASRIVGAVQTKWENDRKQQLAIANAAVTAVDRVGRGLLEIARSLQRAEDRETVDLEAERDTSPISIGSGPIRVQQ